MIKVFSFALSEPMFIAFVLGEVLFLGQYLKSPKRQFLLPGAICASLALLTRYVGVAAVGIGFVALVFLNKEAWRSKLSDLTTFSLISLPPFSAYIVRNIYVAGTATNRTVMFHPIPAAKLVQFVETLSGWLVPISNLPILARQPIFIATLLLLTIGLLWFVREWILFASNWKLSDDKRVLLFVSSCIPVYMISVIIPMLFFDPTAQIPLNYRLLAPLFPLCLATVAGLIERALRAYKTRQVARVLGVICFSMASIYLVQGVRWTLNNVQGLNRDYNYNNRAWQQSGLLATLAILPPELLVYTNEPQVVYFRLNRPTSSLPSKFNMPDGQINESFSARLAAVGSQVQQGKAVIAYFRLNNWPHFPSEGDLEQLPSLVKLKDTTEGALYANEVLSEALIP